MKYLTQLILILLLLTTISTGQTKLIIPVDSNYAQIPAEEIKYITGQFIDYETLKLIHAKTVETIEILKRIIFDKDKLIAIKEDDIKLLRERIEIIMPAWYDRFYLGYAAGILTVALGLLVAK